MQCLGGCGFFGCAERGGYCSHCAAKGVTHAPSSDKCRAGCGFYGNTSKQLGFCSCCFAVLRDDLFLRAVAAAYFDELSNVENYFSAGGVTARRLTKQERDALQKIKIFVSVNDRLADVAAKRNSNSALLLVLQYQDVEDAAPVSSDQLRFVISSLLVRPTASFVKRYGGATGILLPSLPSDAPLEAGEELCENVRLEVLSTTETRADGLVHFYSGLPPVRLVNGRPVSFIRADDDAEPARKLTRLDVAPGVEVVEAVGKSFALPSFVQSLDAAKRHVVLQLFLEQESMTEDITLATEFIPIVPGCGELLGLYTIADLNCLNHAIFQGMCGVRDGLLATDDPDASEAETRTVLRDAIFQTIQSRTFFDLVCAGDDARLKVILADAFHGKASLEGAHVFALANILRRPIVVYSHAGLEGVYRQTLKVPFRISGIYLPLLWNPANDASHSPDVENPLVRDPLMLCFSRGHFSTLVGFVDQSQFAQEIRIPLCDEKLRPLPIVFSESQPEYAQNASAASPTDRLGHTDKQLEVLRLYMRNVKAEVVSDGECNCTVTTCAQLHLPLTVASDDSSGVPEYIQTEFVRYIANIYSSLQSRVVVAQTGVDHRPQEVQEELRGE